MARTLLPALVVVVIAVAAFGGGYWLRGTGGVHPQVLTADCSGSASGGSCMAGDIAYGYGLGTTWIDSTGAFHDKGLPECLPVGSEVKGLQIGADTMWIGDLGWATVFWIDCRHIDGSPQLE